MCILYSVYCIVYAVYTIQYTIYSIHYKVYSMIVVGVYFIAFNDIVTLLIKTNQQYNFTSSLRFIHGLANSQMPPRATTYGCNTRNEFN